MHVNGLYRFRNNSYDFFHNFHDIEFDSYDFHNCFDSEIDSFDFNDFHDSDLNSQNLNDFSLC